MTFVDKRDLIFNQTFPIGQEVVYLLKEQLIHLFDEVKVIEGYELYDIEITKFNKKKYIEVKFDDRCISTGNFAVECESWGKPSGILTTKSDYWVFFDSNKKYYMIKTSILKILCSKLSKIQTGCNDSKNKVFLLKIHEFVKKSIKLSDILTDMEKEI